MRKTYFHFLFLCRNNEMKNYFKYSFDLWNSCQKNSQRNSGETVRKRHSQKSNGAVKYHNKQVNC